MNVVYPLVSVFLVSLVSVIFAIPFLIKKKISQKVLLFLLSLSVGVLLATVFLNFLPEAVSHEYTLEIAFFILSGFMVMFIIEKIVHYHHCRKCEKGDCDKEGAYHLAAVNLIGDSIHNFIDGLVIAGAYAVNVTLGITATISIIFHEIPQEIADFGVLLFSGMSKKKAFFFNFISAVSAIIGALLGIFLVGKMHSFTEFIIPFAAGNFIYIAASNLVPQLHRECDLKDSILHILAILFGIGIVALITLYGPGHGHI